MPLACRLLIWLFCAAVSYAQSGSAVFKAAPAAVSFTYTIGDKLPAAQNVTVSGPAGVTYQATLSAGPWLTVSPMYSPVPATARLFVNPTTLAAGTYTGAITFTPSSGAAVTVQVTLVVKAAPSELILNPKALTFTHTRGLTPPAAATIAVSSTDAALAFSATIAGAPWASVSPKTGFAYPGGFTVPGAGLTGPLTVTVTPGDLVPGSYKATLTIAAPAAKTKSLTVPITLVVNPGLPVISSLWPNRITVGAKDTTVTIQGERFYAKSVVKVGTTELKPTFLGVNALSVVLPENLLKTAGTLNLVVSNPETGGGDSTPAAFTVRPVGPVIDALVNSASYAPQYVAPGEMVTLFGAGLGPTEMATFAPPAPGGSIATLLGGTRVLVDGAAVPLIYTMDEQVAAMIPFAVDGRATVLIQVEYNGVLSTGVSFPVRASVPGVFTTSGSGTGQAVAFNCAGSPAVCTLNSESSPANKGDVLVLYATGLGPTTPPSVDGQITTGATQLHTGLVAEIDGLPATVVYAGGAPGLVAGLSQVNITVPEMKGNKTASLKLTVRGYSSQDGVTVAIK